MICYYEQKEIGDVLYYNPTIPRGSKTPEKSHVVDYGIIGPNVVFTAGNNLKVIITSCNVLFSSS